MDPEWPKKCSAVLENEVLPRAKKLGITITAFCDPAAIAMLIKLEYDGIISRKTLIEILDERVKVLQKNDNI